MSRMPLLRNPLRTIATAVRRPRRAGKRAHPGSGASAHALHRPRFVAALALTLFLGIATLLALSAAQAADAAQGLPGQGFLPDNRAYELISPPDKNGGMVSASSLRTRVAPDGSAVQFLSQTAFPGTNGSSPYGVEYMATRDDDGWRTHSITPSAGAPTFPRPLDNTFQYQGYFSPDFNEGFFLSPNPVTDEDPNVAGVSNLYLRTDLKTPGAGEYRLISACPACSTPLPTETFLVGGRGLAYAGASADFSHVIFESMDNLTADATGSDPKVYEWLRDSGQLRLAGILPDDACGTPPCAASISYAGNSAGGGGVGGSSVGGNQIAKYPLSRNAISADGSKIFFTGPPIVVQGQNFFGELFVREDGSTTTQINVSERSTPDAHKPAMFQGASADGRYVFFISSEALTDDAPPVSRLLYRADLNQPEGERLEYISGAAGGTVNAVVGISQDGSFAYFTTGDSLYVWHNGVTRRIADHNSIRDFKWGGEGSGERAPQGDTFRLLDDGTKAVFVSAHPSTALDTAGYDNTSDGSDSGAGCFGVVQGDPASYCGQVYLYDYASDTLSCVSCNPGSGTRPNAAATFQFSFYSGVGDWPNYQNHPLTADGSKVFFSTTEALVPEDVNGQYDVYQYDTETGERSLISTGQSDQASYFLDASPDGSDVVFTTAERLVGIDTDNQFDLYDARVDGGLESQNPPASAPDCIGDECQGPIDAPPAAHTPGSEGYVGPGNGDRSAARSCARTERRVDGLSASVRKLRRHARQADGRRERRLRRQLKRSRKQLRKARGSLRACRRAK